MSNRARWTPDAFEQLVAQNPEIKNPGSALPLAKKKWQEPDKSKTMKAEMPEASLQIYADELLEIKGLKSIRIPDGMWRWIAANAPEGVKKWWRWLFGGWPDNLILIPCGRYMLALPVELKTADKHGKAVGALHGKQRHNAEAENWTIARSPEAFRETVERAERDAEKINKILVAQTSAY
jgi:hypothetical protein